MSSAGAKCTDCLKGFWSGISRTKSLSTESIQATELKRCLGVVELTALGVGSTLGAGVYVITGQVARQQAGPAIVLSFLVAAVASLLAGLCYAEFAARVPKAGSAYVYSYVSVGEMWAFVIGWNMILENMIGAASVGKAWSQYFDTLFNDTVARYIAAHVPPMQAPGLAEHPDFIALVLLIVSTMVVAIGVKMSSVVSFVFTILNILVIGCVICIGLFHVDGKNWTNNFFPYGFKGVMSGAATCFYAFVGFDTIATSGEEAKQPSKNIPLAIVATLIICFLAYFGVSCVITLMVPYNELAVSAPLPKVFSQTGIYGAEYVIAIGGMCGLVASMMGSIFPLPRIIYAMAKDGVIFRFLANVNHMTSTPFIATVISGFAAAILAMILELESLVEMMSIGTLMAYTLVAVSVLILRYQPGDVGLSKDTVHKGTPDGELGEGESKEKDATGESTGLLRVGNKLNLIKYVPSKQTSVFRRLPHADSEDSDAGSVEQRKEVVEEEIRQKKDDGYREGYDQGEEAAPPTGSTYQRIGPDQSMNSMSSLFNFGGANQEPTEHSRKIVIISVIVISLVLICLSVLCIYGSRFLENASWWAVLLVCVFLAVVITFVVFIVRQPKNKQRLIFRVPFVPFVPIMSLVVDIYLMLSLSTATWIRFAVWMFLGFLIYFGYGLRNSSERPPSEQEVVLYDVSDADGIMNERKKSG
ncbi:high affinity cationic amino acid transporter 1-like [Lineus longissimus]|uniref:high affinity cationic amino acid transporter 1-like n=1 Tax=Lineus longissimus TaxID=88925 RepID=UPI002B4E129B